MAKFLVEMQHEKKECQQTMEVVSGQGPDLLDKVWWSCPSGEHNAWVFVAAATPEDAVNLVAPDNIKNKAKAHEISQLATEDIKEMHKAA